MAHSTHSLTLFEIKLFLWLERARRTRGITGASLLKGEKEKGSLLELLVGGDEKREGKDVIAFVCVCVQGRKGEDRVQQDPPHFLSTTKESNDFLVSPHLRSLSSAASDSLPPSLSLSIQNPALCPLVHNLSCPLASSTPVFCLPLAVRLPPIFQVAQVTRPSLPPTHTSWLCLACGSAWTPLCTWS